MKALTAPYQSLCIVGNAKNAGKTTVLNAMVAALPDLVLGLSSIGLDGEDLDTVSFLPKPQVHVPVGGLVATATDCLARSTCAFELLEDTGIRTGMGNIVIARVTGEGNCLLGGPSTASGMDRALQALSRHGAQKLLIDGAFSRQSHAMVGEAMVYVVGAHQSPRMDRVVHSADLALRSFALPAAETAFRFLKGQEEAGYLDAQGRFHGLGFSSVLGRTEGLIQRVPRDAPWLYLPGALDDALVKQLVKTRHDTGFGLIIASPLSLVMADSQLEKLFRLKRPIRVLEPLTVAFVACNPYSPAGHRFDGAAFKEALAQRTSLPLINVLEESL